MSRVPRLGRMIALTSVLAGSVALVTVAQPAAADSIPRPPGAIEHRGYELVSLPDPNGNNASYVSQPSVSGDHILYGFIGGAAGSSSGARSLFSAVRTAAGWVSDSLLPPAADLVAESYFVTATTPDLTAQAWTAIHGLSQDTQTPSVSLLRIDGSGQTLLHTFPVSFDTNGALAVASDDLSHVYANVPEQIEPSHQAGTRDVYDFGGGTPVLVSRMPGSGLAPRCGVPDFNGSVSGGFVDGVTGAVSQHWVSTDGSRVFFATHGDGAPACSGPLELYAHDRNSETTSLVSGSPVAGDPDNGIDQVIQAAADGSWIVYRTATSLDPADDADGNRSDLDLYRWDAGAGANTCLTCVIPHADVSPTTHVLVDAAVSQDGSHVYFTSTGQYAGATAPGDVSNPTDPVLNTYVLENGTVSYIAQTDGLASRPRDAGQVTPDGNVLIFRSHQTDLDALSGRSNGGFEQYYRYDDSDRSITCMSCPSSGSPSQDVPSSIQTANGQPIPDALNVVTDDGGTVVFATADPLVAADINNALDVYEWHDGEVGLITDGQTTLLSPDIAGISPDGRDIFFLTSSDLTVDSPPGSKKLFDARIDGGFEPPPPAPPPCVDDACQGASPTPPSLGAPGSGSVTGDGNVVPGPAPRLTLARIGASQRTRFARTGKLTLSVAVNGRGTVTATATARLGRHMHTVAHARRASGGAGRLRLQLRFSRAARAQLAARGSLRVRLVMRFSSTAVEQVVLSLRAPRAHGARAAAEALVHASADVG